MARRARFVAAALASVGLGLPACGPGTRPVVSKPEATSSGAKVPSDRDHDGIADKDDLCPDEPEDRDGLEDEDGCPESDVDKDGIPDGEDACPKMPGTKSPIANKNGCPSVCLSIAVSIRITQVILFAPGQSTISKDSIPILDDVAAVLHDHPEIEVEVQGHGDVNEGIPLTEARAKAVTAYLVGKGVEAKRLSPKGFGSGTPIAPNTTAEGRARNRRVAFVRTDGGA